MSFGQCHAEEIYVRVKTGERFFGIDYISRDGNTPMDLFSELAHGTVVNEDEWLKNYPPEGTSLHGTKLSPNEKIPALDESPRGYYTQFRAEVVRPLHQ